MKVTRYICHTWRTIKVLKFLFVLKIVTEFRFWKFRVYFRTFRFEIFSIPKLRVWRWRVSQAVGIFRYSWSNDISGNSGFYIHRFVYSGLSLVVCPTQPTFFDDFCCDNHQSEKYETNTAELKVQKPWIFKILNIQKRKRNLRNHEYPPQAHGEA